MVNVTSSWPSIAKRIVHPCSKLATARRRHSATLAEELSVQDADEDDLYEAMDWLLERRAARRRASSPSADLKDGCTVLYDVSSSYYEGGTCPLARLGHDRDGAEEGCR